MVEGSGNSTLVKIDPNGKVVADRFALNTTGYNGINDLTPGDINIDLSSDQCTIYYTYKHANTPDNAFNNIKRYNVCSHTQLPDFANSRGPGLPQEEVIQSSGSLRLLPSGGLLLANGGGIILSFDSTGKIIQTYDIPTRVINNDPRIQTSGSATESLSLNLGGKSFWTNAGGYIYQIDLATGRVLQVLPVSSDNLDSLEGRLAIAGEVRAPTTPSTNGTLPEPTAEVSNQTLTNIQMNQ